MKALHLTSHSGTIRHVNNIFKLLNISDRLVTESFVCREDKYIDHSKANAIWAQYAPQMHKYRYVIFTDTSMVARPFLQNMDQHHLTLIIYITNRFDWGMFGFRDNEYYKLYSNMAKHPRVIFCADNHYDQYYASINNIYFPYESIKLIPEICDEIKTPICNRFFIYDRGTKISDYQSFLNDGKIPFDVYSPQHRYRDTAHISEYLGFIHLPYQVNIQSLWENIGYGVIYFIPSKDFITKLIFEKPWYYWEEKVKSREMIIKSIELSEWYTSENIHLFEYFDSWEDLANKCHSLTQEYIATKRQRVLSWVKSRNDKYINMWSGILKYMLTQLPTIVTMFYDIRRREEKKFDHNRKIEKYLELAKEFILKLPYPLVVYTDEPEIIQFIERERVKLKDFTMIYNIKLEDTYYYRHHDQLHDLQKKYTIHNINLEHESPLYVLLNNNKFFFLEQTVKQNPFNSSHYVWMDFGLNHVAKSCNEIHNWFIRVPDKIRQLCINPFVENGDNREIFKYIYHHTAGGLFSGSGVNLLKYCQLFKDKIEKIYGDGWYQLDEAVMTMIQRENSELFDFFYGDYQGIVCNYLSPIHNIDLILRGASKCLNHGNTKFAFDIINYCLPYFKNNMNNEYIYNFINISIICCYYHTPEYLLPEIITIINSKISKNDERMISLIKSQQNNLNFYKNKDLIIKPN